MMIFASVGDVVASDVGEVKFKEAGCAEDRVEKESMD